MSSKCTIAVEHLDPELGEWSTLEYATIARESNEAGIGFLLTGVDSSLELPSQLKSTPGFQFESQSTEKIYSSTVDKVCLLDPGADKELSPEDGSVFEVFLFGGILGIPLTRREFIRARQ